MSMDDKLPFRLEFNNHDESGEFDELDTSLTVCRAEGGSSKETPFLFEARSDNDNTQIWLSDKQAKEIANFINMKILDVRETSK